MKSICVFCGSRDGVRPQYRTAAEQLGSWMAEAGLTLVYGGAKVGMMGAVAAKALEGSGKVVGVLPHFLQRREVAEESLTELILVDSMHERKRIMYERSDAFIALPGGFGTMDELFEILTWSQLGLHKKPIGIWNIDGFYDPLLQQADLMLREGYLAPDYRKLLLSAKELEELMSLMQNFHPGASDSFIREDQI